MARTQKTYMKQSNLLVEKLLSRFSQAELIPILSELLRYSTDAIYRQIKRNTPFTFDEALLIIKEMGMDLDSFVETTTEVKFSMRLDNLRANDIVTRYYNSVNESLDNFGREEFHRDSILKLAYNFIPSAFYLNYPELKRFILFKWMYQYDPDFSFKSISEFTVPQDIAELNTKRKLVIQGFKMNEYVLDRHIFQSMADDIMYIARIKLITAEELKVLKEEMLQLVADVESIAVNGVFPLTGNPVNIYISQIDFHFCYTYFRTADAEYSRIRLYLLNNLDSSDPRICRMHEECINSLKRYSVLISHSNEIFRINYFREQRELLEKTLLNDK